MNVDQRVKLLIGEIMVQQCVLQSKIDEFDKVDPKPRDTVNPRTEEKTVEE